MKNFKNKFTKFIKKLPFTEKMLLLFMTIIYTQIIYNLLCNEITDDNTSPIDTIVRTAASSIFGYFLGTNLDLSDDADKEVEPTVKINYNKKNTNAVIVSGLGIISLLIMLYVRNFTTLNYSSVASISQLKDFVSASVGYLVSKSSHSD